MQRFIFWLSSHCCEHILLPKLFEKLSASRMEKPQTPFAVNWISFSFRTDGLSLGACCETMHRDSTVIKVQRSVVHKSLSGQFPRRTWWLAAFYANAGLFVNRRTARGVIGCPIYFSCPFFFRRRSPCNTSAHNLSLVRSSVLCHEANVNWPSISLSA